MLASFALITPAARADEPAAPDSPLVKLLKSKRVPEARMGAIVDMIGKRGSADDLEFIFQQAIAPDGFPAPIKVKALEALAEAARNRGLRPARGLRSSFRSFSPGRPRLGRGLEKTAVASGGLWKLESRRRGAASLWPRRRRPTICCARLLWMLWPSIGGQAGRSRIEALCRPP